MTTTPITLDPCVSEFDTAEQEAEHTAWIRAELERRRNVPSPSIPHDEVVMAHGGSFSFVEDVSPGRLHSQAEAEAIIKTWAQ